MNQILAAQSAQGHTYGATLGNASEDKTPAKNAMRVLHLSLDRVEEQVRSLQQRLRPVMTPEHVSEPANTKVPTEAPLPPRSALVEELWTMDAQLSRISESLAHTSNRLEV